MDCFTWYREFRLWHAASLARAKAMDDAYEREREIAELNALWARRD